MTFVWVAVILLGLMALMDLVVGMSNDAVNFLNAAIGSRVARRKIVYWVAAAGLVIGVFLSVGMMEVARNGVIYPSSFTFTELMVVFIAVMLTDILLIDGFNTLGFPTSTTIAVVFELLGGAMALSLIKKGEARLDGIEVEHFINTDRVFVILAGIILSIFLAFIVGILVQFLTRILFSFHYKRRFKVLFSLVGGLAISAIVFMIFKKALGGSLFSDDAWFLLVQQYMPDILIGVFAFSTFIFLFLGLSFDIDIPGIVVFIGTFALALSVAANDLVNFIGLPLTALESFKVFLASGSASPDTFSMHFLSSNILEKDIFMDLTYIVILSLAGLVMVVTLFYSKKLHGVTETEVYLGRQSVGYERFEPSYLSRIIVRNFLQLHNLVVSYMPKKLVQALGSRYRRAEVPEGTGKMDGVVYFDSVRAAVNLVVASLLISIGTYMRFPLSTTFVVFMVAMGTSLADQAWGRESAVYRVSGVLSIIGGWFFTACLAFIGAFIFAYIIWYGSWPATLFLMGLVIGILIKTRIYFRKKQEEMRVLKEDFQDEALSNKDYLLETGGDQIRRDLLEASKVYLLALQGFVDQDIRQISEAHSKAESLQKFTRDSKAQLFYTYSKITEDTIDSGHYFIQAFDYLTELVGCLNNITLPLYQHIENQHRGLTDSQRRDMQELLDEVSAFFNHIVHVEKEQNFELINEMTIKQSFLLGFLEDLRKNQIKRIQAGEGRTRISILFLDVLAETKNVLLYSINLLKSHRDFVASSGKGKTIR